MMSAKPGNSRSGIMRKEPGPGDPFFGPGTKIARKARFPGKS